MIISAIRRMLGYSGGLCEKLRVAADELTATAKELRHNILWHEQARDPFASILSTAWNNHEHIKADKKVSIK